MVQDLIFDIGMHNGNDTAYYLFRGFRVVAVEANPLLAERGGERFADEISRGRLTILNVGIAPDEGTRTFWVNESNSEWSSFVREVGCRDGACHPVDVPCRPLRSILREHGVPHYLKIDIEGFDIHCLRDLDPADLPEYVSIEAHTLDYLCLLSALGYNAFKCVNQLDHNNPVVGVDNESLLSRLRRRALARPGLAGALRAVGVNRLVRRLRPSPRAAAPAPDGAGDGWTFPQGSSGPFGDATAGDWQPLEDLAYNWLHLRLGYPDRGTLDFEGWHDFHATRLDPPPTGRLARRAAVDGPRG